MTGRLAPLLLATVLAAQSQLPSFEVASIKPTTTGGLALSPTRNGRRITWGTWRNLIIRYAFHLPGWRISGVEPVQDLLAIDATAETAPSEDQLRQMFQRLLIERFHLAYHWETKELPGYAIVRGKGEPKIHPVPDGSKPAPLPDYMGGKEEAIPLWENHAMVTVEGKGILALMARRATLAQVAEALGEPLSAIVEDKTGLNGKFYFAFKFAREDSIADPDVPSIFAAVQEQLGLKLEKQKGPVQILVVDHIDALPTAN